MNNFVDEYLVHVESAWNIFHEATTASFVDFRLFQATLSRKKLRVQTPIIEVWGKQANHETTTTSRHIYKSCAQFDDEDWG